MLGTSRPYSPAMSMFYWNTTEFNGTYTLTNLTVKRIRPGTYHLFFLIEGMESIMSPPITINIVPASISIFPDVSEPLVACFTIVIILVLNTIYANVFISILSIFLAGLEILLVQQSTKGETFQVLSLTILSLLVILNGYMTISELSVDENRKAHFSYIRIEVYKKYTLQILFENRPIPCETDKTSPSKKALKEKEDEEKGIDPDEGHIGYIIPFKKRSFIERVASMIRPFTYELDHNQRIQDAFYYPQRFMAAILLGMLTFIYFCFQVTKTFLSLLARYLQ